MPNVDRCAPIITMCEPEPTMTVYPGEPPLIATDVWIQTPADPSPSNAALVSVKTIGRVTVCVYCRPRKDDREGGYEDTTIRTYH